MGWAKNYTKTQNLPVPKSLDLPLGPVVYCILLVSRPNGHCLRSLLFGHKPELYY